MIELIERFKYWWRKSPWVKQKKYQAKLTRLDYVDKRTLRRYNKKRAEIAEVLAVREKEGLMMPKVDTRNAPNGVARRYTGNRYSRF